MPSHFKQVLFGSQVIVGSKRKREWRHAQWAGDTPELEHPL
jgi:hypothetical protein